MQISQLKRKGEFETIYDNGLLDLSERSEFLSYKDNVLKCTNDYDIYEYYPQIDAEWDGQVCMTMEKILNFIKKRDYIQTK